MSKRKDISPLPLPPEKASRRGGLERYFGSSSAAATSEVTVEAGAAAPLSSASDTAAAAAPDTETAAETDTSADADDPTPTPAPKWPDDWDDSQQKTFKEKYPWVNGRDGKLGCLVCEKIDKLKLQGKMGQAISREWALYTVCPYGSTRTSRLSSLRKKISIHVNSSSHAKAEQVLKQQGQSQVQSGLMQHGAISDAETERVFRTVYEMAQSNIAFNELNDLIVLQKLNGVKIGITLHSRFSAANITEVIAVEMRKKMVSQVLRLNRKITVIIDEASTVSKKPVLVVVLRTDVSADGKGEPVFLFLELVELEAQTAAYICSAIKNCLLTAGFTLPYLQDNWVCLVSDGANVMFGKKSGVGVRLKAEFPKIFLWHCMNHRLELAVGDAINATSNTFQFKTLLDKMYSTYSQSTKALRELQSIAADLSTRVLKLGRVLSNRWVPSSFRSVHAVWTNYEALHGHFVFASTDASRRGEERAPFVGLARRMQSKELLHDIGLMYDVLETLSVLSKSLQQQGMTLLTAHKRIETTIRVLSSFKELPGPKYAEVLKAMEEGSFRGIELTENTRNKTIAPNEFLDALIVSMEDRLLDPSVADWQILSDMAILDQSEWPEETNIRHGENEVRRLCRRFGFDEATALAGLRDLIHGGPGDDLRPLQQCVRGMPPGSAEAERSFSHMNIVNDEDRYRLLVTTTSNILFIKLNGPPLSEWRPQPYVAAWKILGHRSATDTRTKPKKSLPVTDVVKSMRDLWRVM